MWTNLENQVCFWQTNKHANIFHQTFESGAPKNTRKEGTVNLGYLCVEVKFLLPSCLTITCAINQNGVFSNVHGDITLTMCIPVKYTSASLVPTRKLSTGISKPAPLVPQQPRLAGLQYGAHGGMVSDFQSCLAASSTYKMQVCQRYRQL